MFAARQPADLNPNRKVTDKGGSMHGVFRDITQTFNIQNQRSLAMFLTASEIFALAVLTVQ
jgi:hypothetical protein